MGFPIFGSGRNCLIVLFSGSGNRSNAGHLHHPDIRPHPHTPKPRPIDPFFFCLSISMMKKSAADLMFIAGDVMFIAGRSDVYR
ncbi:hypothetical protein HanOQP8_Chr03g0104161 [Helianthus annuus]|nr:hypothetical protein HanOQP8_Chr03g0104161 [Helianthus annuus]